MSTTFTTRPALTYDQVLASQQLVFETPARDIYVKKRHMLARSRSGVPDGQITLVECGDRAEFERFGRQNAEILTLVAEEFGVEVYDEHGLRFPDESDG